MEASVTETAAPATGAPWQRALVYVVVAAAVCVVLWALLQGADRNLWTMSSVFDWSYA